VYTLLIDTYDLLMVNFAIDRAARRKYVPSVTPLAAPGAERKHLKDERKFHPKDKSCAGTESESKNN
jgi:hypothetical protein